MNVKPMHDGAVSSTSSNELIVISPGAADSHTTSTMPRVATPPQLSLADDNNFYSFYLSLQNPRKPRVASNKKWHCQRCKNHNISVFIKGHKFCPFKCCPCEKCQLIEERRLASNELKKQPTLPSYLSTTDDERDTNGDTVKRKVRCQKCRAHGEKARSHHKNRCPHGNCTCDWCTNIEASRTAAKKQMRLRRQQRGRECTAKPMALLPAITSHLTAMTSFTQGYQAHVPFMQSISNHQPCIPTMHGFQSPIPMPPAMIENDSREICENDDDSEKLVAKDNVDTDMESSDINQEEIDMTLQEMAEVEAALKVEEEKHKKLKKRREKKKIFLENQKKLVLMREKLKELQESNEQLEKELDEIENKN